jgi:hypothetical protein
MAETSKSALAPDATLIVPIHRVGRVLWLQGITLVWMVVECGVSLWGAVQARSPVLLAFGADSFVELLSAVVVVMQFSPRWTLSERKAHRIAAALLIALAIVVTGIASLGLIFHLRPERSGLGIAITLAALIVMPVLAVLKRREALRQRNGALAADAVQSATCAYLALIALTGLSLNAIFHLAWADSLAALAVVPLLIKEAREAWRGSSCSCCY